MSTSSRESPIASIKNCSAPQAKDLPQFLSQLGDLMHDGT